MGFQTPMYSLQTYLSETLAGKIQLPDFQRGYKWDDERIRQLLITVLRGHPLGVVMLLETGNSQVRFKPRSIRGVTLEKGTEPEKLLLDGQQRLTSLTQALTGDGVVHTKNTSGKLLERRYFLNIETAVTDPSRMDEAVISIPADGVIRENFGRDIVLDLSTIEKQCAAGYFPLNLLVDPNNVDWILEYGNSEFRKLLNKEIIQPALNYKIPAIELDRHTDKAAVATVFEKVNIGGLPLNVFELLTALYAGDASYYAQSGEDFRLNDDWRETQHLFAEEPVLNKVESTDFLQAATMLVTRKKNLSSTAARRPQVSAKREDVLDLELNDYLEFRDALREAFLWSAKFLADLHIFNANDIPYPKQLVPLAAIRVVMGKSAENQGPTQRLVRWFWSGVIGELYGGASETRFVRDLETVPAWALDETQALPRTVLDANFVESRLHSMRTRNSAAYKGVYALIMGQGARDWMEAKQLGASQYSNLAIDIHHIFPKKWCYENGIDDEHRESIVNKTAISARTNRIIGGVAPSLYLGKIQRDAGIQAETLNENLASHLVDPMALQHDDFEGFFATRRENLCQLIETAIGKTVQRDLSLGHAQEDSSKFDLEDLTEDEQDA